MQTKAESPAAEPTAAKAVFTRTASGYTRELSQVHQFFYNWAWVPTILVYLYPLYFGLAAYYYPGADIWLATLISFAISIVMCGVYSMMGSAMPRSGGDYVWISRILSPALAAVLALSYWVFYVGWIVFNAIMFQTNYLGVPIGLAGLLSNTASLTNFGNWAASTQGYVVIGLSLAIFLPFLLLFGGMRWFRKMLDLDFLCVNLAIIGFFVALFAAVGKNVPDTFNQYLGPGGYQGLIDLAKQKGWSGIPSFTGATFSLGDTIVLAMMMLGAGLIWSWVSVTIFGEIKGVTAMKKTLLSMILPVIGTVLAPAYVYASYEMIGPQFATAVYYLGWIGDASVNKLPFSWTILILYWPFMTLGSWVAMGLLTLIGVTLTLNIACYTNSANMVIPVRYIFAEAFDGVYPRILAYMHPKRHIPIVGYIIIVIGSVAWLIATLIWPSLWGFVASVIAGQVAIFIFAAVAAVVFPYRLKDVYKASPCSKYSLGKIPLISILGVLGAISMAYLCYAFLAYAPLGGVVNVPTMAAVLVVGLVFYYVAKLYRKYKEGVNLDLVFKEVPPA